MIKAARLRYIVGSLLMVSLAGNGLGARAAQPPEAGGDAQLVTSGRICLTNACDDATVGRPAEARGAAAAAPIPSGGAFARDFDGNAPVLIRGVLTDLRLPGPGLSAEFIIQSDDGKIFRVIGGDSASMTPEMRASAQIGAAVIIRGYLGRDTSCNGGCLANGRDITYADGTKIFMGSAGAVAPRDGADPSQR